MDRPGHRREGRLTRQRSRLLMDRSLKWRFLALFFVTVFCCATLASTFVGHDALPTWFNRLFTKKINLGLDLQGGMHIVYNIALDKAVDDKASEIKRDLETRFLDDKVTATVKTPQVSPTMPLGAVSVVVADANKRAEIKKQIESDYDFVTERTCQEIDGADALCYQVSKAYAESIKKSALANAVNTIRERIDEKGVAEPSVIEKGDDIIVELPGDPDDPVITDTRNIIARTAKLEFKVVDNGSTYMNKLYAHIADRKGATIDPIAMAEGIFADAESWQPENGGARQSDVYIYAHDREDEWVGEDEARAIGCLTNKNRDKLEGGKIQCKVTGRHALERYMRNLIKADASFKVPDDRQLAYERNEALPDAKDQRVVWRSYFLDRAVRLTGSAISNATANYDPNTNRPLVLLDFNRFGGRIFGDLTAQIAGKKLATILDDTVKSAPIINDAIRGGRASITMGAGDAQRQERERDELVNVLKTGSLPAPLVEASQSKVGATLGRDAIEKTRLSFILGIILVVIIMVGVYRWSGWISVFAVVFHIVMTLAVMALFGATLTLPGIAAIVLSIGMEVDGNILIYERIRDELLLGKSVRGSIDVGFSRAFSAILDGQLTTAAAGWVLLQYGSGPIKGFAVMLLVGVFTTLTTNIWVTRIFFDWTVSRKKGQLATISI
ncbi:MAG: protein translocase subunit SecD [Proteobacteria bacterium]|nr:protein translocase subunit SecD [Pseudomonadota bacterium]